MRILVALIVIVSTVDGLPAQSPEARKILNNIIERRVEVTPAELHRILLEYLNDADLRMREGALMTIAARAQAKPRQPNPGWEAEIAALDSLRSHVLNALNEQSRWQVRRAAIWALVNLDFAKEWGFLSRDAIEALLSQYYREPNAEIRSEIVKSFTLSKVEDGRVVLMMDNGLTDEFSRTRFYAVRGIARLKPEQSFEKLMRLTRDTDNGVRFGAWTALPNYGGMARARLPELERIAEFEKDQSVQKAIRDALTRLKSDGL